MNERGLAAERNPQELIFEEAKRLLPKLQEKGVIKAGAEELNDKDLALVLGQAAARIHGSAYAEVAQSPEMIAEFKNALRDAAEVERKRADREAARAAREEMIRRDPAPFEAPGDHIEEASVTRTPLGAEGRKEHGRLHAEWWALEQEREQLESRSSTVLIRDRHHGRIVSENREEALHLADPNEYAAPTMENLRALRKEIPLIRAEIDRLKKEKKGFLR